MKKTLLIFGMTLIFALLMAGCGGNPVSYYDDPTGEKVMQENQELLEQLEDESEKLEDCGDGMHEYAEVSRTKTSDGNTLVEYECRVCGKTYHKVL